MVLPLVVRDAALPTHGWRARWLSDLDAAVVAGAAALAAAMPDGDHGRAEPSAAARPQDAAPETPLQVRDAVCGALAPWLQLAGTHPVRAHLDPGRAALGAVVDPAARVVWLGSPRFEFERRLTTLAAQRSAELAADAADAADADFADAADGAVAADAAAPFASAWVGAHDGPLDIEIATAAFGLADLTRAPDDATAGPSAADVTASDGAATGVAATQDAPRRGRAPLPLDAIEAETRALATRVHRGLDRYRPGLLERVSQWGLGLQADYAVLRVHVLRFVALLPSLDHDRGGAEVRRLLVEMLRRTRRDSRRARTSAVHAPLPAWLEVLFSFALVLTSVLPAALVAALTRWGVRRLAGIFIAGESIDTAGATLAALQRSGRSATVDQLGELVVCEAEADAYRDEVMANVRGVATQFGRERNVAAIPLAHVSVKVSALGARYDPDDPEGTWVRVGPRLLAILQLAQERGVFVHIDAEHYAARDLTWGMLTRALRSDAALWTWGDVGIVVQAYLRDAPAHLADVLALGRERGVAMPLRLVKGAYWDAETTEADAHGFDAPQWLNKVETDLCFQQLVVEVLAHGDAAQLCIGSHNLRDHCFARALRSCAFPEAPEIEHQALHATYEALSTAMAAEGWAVRNYIPVGSLLVGMAYLVRRIMENSSQVGVLTMARGGVPLAVALTSPAQALEAQRAAGRLIRRPNVRLSDDRADQLTGPEAPAGLAGLVAAGWPAFRNVAPARLDRASHRAGLQAAIAADALVAWARGPARAPGSPADPGRSGPALQSADPSSGDVLAALPNCTADDVSTAVARAAAAQPAWAARDDRPALLLRAAERMTSARDHWAVLVAREAGKGRREALGDVDEAIDFLRFYAEEAARRRWAGPERAPRGVLAVIAPWNFPLAIPCGMAVAGLAAGCATLLKSAEQTPLVAEALVRLLHAVGVPPAALHHLPGDGPQVGAPLVAAPAVAGVVFTGSKTVGTLLHSQLAAAAHGAEPRQVGKVVVTEMGGKNAVVITANADLDEATGACLHAAFDHAGQKCSAASRLLVDHRVFEAFSARFARAASDMVVGAALDPRTQINPVISAAEATRLRDAQRAAADECTQRRGHVLLSGADRTDEAPPEASCRVAPAVFRLPANAHEDETSFARRELFGPVVHVLPYVGLDEAMALFNHTEYGLTGGVFAQSEDDIERLRQGLHCGNLYVNRSNTGARVGVEPFGGFKMSGTGPKAGDRGYLDAFLAARGEAKDASVGALVVDPDTPLAGMPVWPLATSLVADAREQGAALAAALCAGSSEASPETAPPHPTSAPHGSTQRDVLGALATYLAKPASGPRATLPIPGQETENHRTLARGLTMILGARTQPGPTGLAHLVAAVSAGAPTLIVAPEGAHAGWVAVIKAARAAGLPPDRVELVAADDAGEAASWASLSRLATLVIDAPRAPWSPLLTQALTRRTDPKELPKVWCAHDGPPLEDPEALVAAHQVVRTVAVNTMRHGAPLSLHV